MRVDRLRSFVAQLLLVPVLPIDLLYVVPVVVVAATGGWRLGLLAAVLAACLRSLAELPGLL